MPVSSVPPGRRGLWSAVDRLIDRSEFFSDLRTHRLELLTFARWRELGLEVPAQLLEEARLAAMKALAAPLLLQQVRAVCSDSIVLLKGPETAAYYEDPSLRSFGDLDLLVPDPVGTQRALLAAGFRAVGEERLYLGIHHLRPLHYPSFPLHLEIHARPKWPEGILQPSVAEIFDTAVPARVAVDGILAPPPTYHALLLAAHSWAHEPLGTLRHLVDIAAVRQDVADTELEELARHWGLERIWRLTASAVDAVLFDGMRPLPLRLWARNLPQVRDRTVLEQHLQRWLAPFSAYPVGPATRAAARAIGTDARREAGEDWRTKRMRTRKAIKNTLRRRSEHDAELATLEESRP